MTNYFIEMLEESLEYSKNISLVVNDDVRNFEADVFEEDDETEIINDI